MRSTVSLRPATCSPATACRLPPKGSSPSTQIFRLSASGNAEEGQSTNLVKL